MRDRGRWGGCETKEGEMITHEAIQRLRIKRYNERVRKVTDLLREKGENKLAGEVGAILLEPQNPEGGER